MFCPKCAVEYRPGTELCADCGVPLVAARPPIPPDRLIEGVHILSTYNVGDIAFVRSLLEANNIPFLFHGENFTIVDPLIQPARLVVPPEYAETVRELLRDTDLHYSGINIAKPAPEGDDDDEA